MEGGVGLKEWDKEAEGGSWKGSGVREGRTNVGEARVQGGIARGFQREGRAILRQGRGFAGARVAPFWGGERGRREAESRGGRWEEVVVGGLLDGLANEGKVGAYPLAKEELWDKGGADLLRGMKLRKGEVRKKGMGYPKVEWSSGGGRQRAVEAADKSWEVEDGRVI
ncbi:hypothetical protein AMTR_s00054p00049180, partial [Amborella trichopoda]